MRYKILRPGQPIDPRFAGFDSLTDLYLHIPSVSEVVEERDAIEYVRRTHPDALAMPFQCKLGSGHVTLLGLIPHTWSEPQEGSAIPFILFVYAVPENNRDKHAITNHKQFTSDLWKPPVLEPEDPHDTHYHRVSIRASESPQYPAIYAKTFRRNGKQIVFLEIGESKMSIEFLDDSVRLERGTSITSG